MAQGLRKKFKRILKKGEANIRDICIITCQYLKDVHDIKISPVDYRDSNPRKHIMHNFMLARAHYMQQFGYPIGSPDKPDSPKDKQFFTNSEYGLEQYDSITDTWIEITEPNINLPTYNEDQSTHEEEA